MATSAAVVDPQISTVKELADLIGRGAASFPSAYAARSLAAAAASCDTVLTKEEIPVVDFSRLTRATPDERSMIILEIGRACEEWGCFAVVNHGVPESLRTAVLEAFAGFFNLPVEEKDEYKMKRAFDPICHGTGLSLKAAGAVRYWRDYLKIFVHPTLNSPAKPPNFRILCEEFGRESREMMKELLRAISEGLGLEGNYMENSLQLNLWNQVIVGNLYPPCPEPALALGLPPHSDPSLITALIQTNGYDGLQVMRHGEWITVHPVPGSFTILVGAFLEIASNGRCKSAVHRTTVDDRAARISVGSGLSPPPENVKITPAPKLVENAKSGAKFRSVTCQEFIQLFQSNSTDKSELDLIRM